MKHAGADTLHRLAPLLQRLRAIPGLTERKPGIFYLRASAFLHFHEDPAGIFADVKLDGVAFERFALRGPEDGAALCERVAAVLSAGRSTAPPSAR